MSLTAENLLDSKGLTDTLLSRGMRVRRASRLTVEVLTPGSDVGIRYDLPVPALRGARDGVKAWSERARAMRQGGASHLRMQAIVEFLMFVEPDLER